MKTKKMQVLIKVIFTKDFASHSKGNVIATDFQTVNFLVKKGVCEMYTEKPIEKKVEEVVSQELAEVKRRGRPSTK